MSEKLINAAVHSLVKSLCEEYGEEEVYGIISGSVIGLTVQWAGMIPTIQMLHDMIAQIETAKKAALN